MVWVHHRVPQEDLDQERELARLEGRDPEQAVRAYITRERHFSDAIVPLWEEPRIASSPMSVFRYRRSPGSVERRHAYTREWWRKNGAEYRRKRTGWATKESAGSRQSRSMTAGTNEP